MIELKNISKYYSQDNNVTLGLRNINVTLSNNEFIAITGESGSGKTTFLNVISGIDTYEEGEMYFNGEETSYFSLEDFEKYRKENIGFIFQNYNLIDSYTVLQNVEIPLILKGIPKEERVKRAKEIIEKVGLTARLHHRGTKLSGGEKQRVVIARALASDAKILACDEPTGNLDTETGRQIIELLKEISQDKLVLIVTHNYEQVEKYCTRKLRFFDGELVEDREVNPTPKTVETKIEVIKENVKEHNAKTASWFSVLNLINTPKKTFLTFLVFVAAIFAFMALITNLNEDYSPYIYLQDFNLSDDRIILKNKNNEAFSTDYLQTLRNNSNAKYLETADQISDIQLWGNISTQNMNVNLNFFGFRDVDSFGALGKLKYGRFPEKGNEVLINAYEYMFDDSTLKSLLNQTIKLSSNNNLLQPLEVKIVGFYDSNISYNDSPIYGTKDLKSAFFDFYASNKVYNYFNIMYDGEKINSDFEFRSDITKPILQGNSMLTPEKFKINVYDYYQSLEVKDFEFVSVNESYVKIIVPYNYLYSLQKDVYQVSVYLKNTYNLKDQVQSFQNDSLTLLHKMLFTNSQEDLFGIINNIAMVFVSFLCLVIISIFTSIIIYFILNYKKKDYAIFRSLGANNKILKKIILFENLILCLIGNFFLMILCGILGKIFQIKMFSPFYNLDWTIITLCVLGTLFLAWFISIRFNKAIFKKSVNHNLRKDA